MTTISTQTPFSLKNPKALTDEVKERKLRSACHDFEAVIIKKMLDTMRQSTPKNSLLGEDGYADKMYQSMRDDEMAQELAKGKGMGLGEVLYKQLSGQAKTIGK